MLKTTGANPVPYFNTTLMSHISVMGAKAVLQLIWQKLCHHEYQIHTGHRKACYIETFKNMPLFI